MKKIIQQFPIVILLSISISCTKNQLTIHYDTAHEQQANQLADELKQLSQDVDVSLALVDYPHDFRTLTFIHGAYFPSQQVSTQIYEVLQEFPMELPVARSNHVYNANTAGLYLVAPYQPTQYYSCLSGDFYFEWRENEPENLYRFSADDLELVTPQKIYVLHSVNNEDASLLHKPVLWRQSLLHFNDSLGNNVSLKRLAEDSFRIDSPPYYCRMNLRNS